MGFELHIKYNDTGPVTIHILAFISHPSDLTVSNFSSSSLLRTQTDIVVVRYISIYSFSEYACVTD